MQLLGTFNLSKKNEICIRFVSLISTAFTFLFILVCNRVGAVKLNTTTMTQKQSISESSSTPSTKILNGSTELDTFVERSGPYFIPFLLAVFVIFIFGLIFTIRRTKKFLEFSYPESLILSTERQRNFTYDPSIVETNVFSIDRVEDEIDETMMDSIFNLTETNRSYFALSSNNIDVSDEFPNCNLDESKIMPQAIQKSNEMLEDNSNSKDL